jgi:AsmA protein
MEKPAIGGGKRNKGWSMRVKRHQIWLILAGVFVFLPIIGAAGFILSFNPNRYAPVFVHTIEAATGRPVTIGGPITLKLSLNPILSAKDVTLANAAGFNGANLAQTSRLEAKFSLLGLLSHRLDILSLTLVDPIITLSTNAAGQTNWDLATPKQTPGETGSAPATTSHRHYKIALEAVVIQNGEIIIQGNKPASTTTITTANLTGRAASASAPLQFSGTAAYQGAIFTLTGTTGPIERFSGIGTGPWPVDLTLDAPGINAHVQGTIAHPRTGSGYDFQIHASAASLQAITSLLPSKTPTLPPIQNITLSAHVADQGGNIPAITGLSITLGTADLSNLRPGLRLDNATLTMASLTQTVQLTASGACGTLPLTITGTLGAPQLLIQAATAPPGAPPAASYPVAFQVQVSNTAFTVTGAVATPARLAGVALAINATIPNLATLDPIAGLTLPAWTNITLQTTLTDPGGQGLVDAIGLDGIAVTMDHAAFGGDLHFIFGKTPNLQVALQAQSIDADALRAAFAEPPAAGTAPSATQAPTPPTPFLISTQTLPLGWLRVASGDAQLAVTSLIVNHATYTGLQAHAVLSNGLLTLKPVTGELPGGAVTAAATLDATKDPAAATLSISAPALALAPALQSLGLANTAQGTLQASLTATATGDSPHALAASVNGQVGLAMVNGIVDGALLDQLFGAMLRSIGLPADLAGAHGPVPVRCFAFRLDAANGDGTIRTLTLDSNRLLIQGAGDVNFDTEALGVILRPELRIGNAEAGVPVEIDGSFALPTLVVAPKSALTDAVKAAIGLPTSAVQQIVGPKTLVGSILNDVTQAAPPDVCPAALALGRLGQPGSAAPPPPQPATADKTTPITGPKNLLKILFGK